MSKATAQSQKDASAFLKRAERAFQRAAKTVQAESDRLGLKPVTWKSDKEPKTKK